MTKFKNFLHHRTHQPAKSMDGGFTIIELIFATLIFSLVMLVILVSSFQIGRIYYKGVSISNTSEAARTVLEDIAGDVRFANLASCADSGTNPQNCLADGGNTHYFCVGLHRYSYVLNKQVTNQDINDNKMTGVRQDVIKGGCTSPADEAGTDAKQLLGPDMQLNRLNFACANGFCSARVHVIFYGADKTVFSSSSHLADTDSDHTAALNDPDAFCSGNLLSSQFCAMADLQTKVLQRL